MGGSRWEDGAHTPALRRRASERASARGLSVAPELGAGRGPRRRDRVGAACGERVSRSGTPTPGSGARTPASPGSRAPSRRSRQAPGLRAALLRPRSGKRGWSPSGSPGGEGGRGRGGGNGDGTDCAGSGLSLLECPCLLNPLQSPLASVHRQGAGERNPPTPSPLSPALLCVTSGITKP